MHALSPLSLFVFVGFCYEALIYINQFLEYSYAFTKLSHYILILIQLKRIKTIYFNNDFFPPPPPPPPCKGDNESGKTTLIAKLQGVDEPKKGTGLEYYYIDVKDEYRDGKSVFYYAITYDIIYTDMPPFLFSEKIPVRP